MNTWRLFALGQCYPEAGRGGAWRGGVGRGVATINGQNCFIFEYESQAKNKFRVSIFDKTSGRVANCEGEVAVFSAKRWDRRVAKR